MSPYVTSAPPIPVEGVEAYNSHHTRPHAVIASLAGNRILALTMQSVGQIVTHHVAVSYRICTHASSASTSPSRALASGRVASATARMTEHISGLADLFRDETADRVADLIEWRWPAGCTVRHPEDSSGHAWS